MAQVASGLPLPALWSNSQLPPATLPLTGAEVFNVSQINNGIINTRRVTIAQALSAAAFAPPQQTVYTAAGPLNVSGATNNQLILVNRAVTATLSVVLPLVSAQPGWIMVRDIKGDASTGAPINVTFSGGQLADGLATVPIATAYGGYFFWPISSLNNWFLGTS